MSLLETPQVTELMQKVEEAIRASDERVGIKRFQEPRAGILTRIKSKRHHIIFGRRGSGKSSLLFRALDDLKQEGYPVVYLNMDDFKERTYSEAMIDIMQKFLSRLNEQIPTPRGHEMEEKTREAFENELLNEQARISFLKRRFSDYQRVLRDVALAAGKDIFLLIDDLYQMHRPDQAPLLDYLHRMAKGNNLWLKIGTIRYRTKYYAQIKQDDGFVTNLGLNIGHDADNIDLDVTLEQYSTTKNFLIQILRGFMNECGLNSIRALMTEKSVDRLVLASGGVARDFLSIVRRSLEEAITRLSEQRTDVDAWKQDEPDSIEHDEDDTTGNTPTITVRDVYSASGLYFDLKQTELLEDSLDDKDILLEEFKTPCTSCYKSQANVFLVDSTTGDPHRMHIHELADLRFIHQISNHITISDRPTHTYSAYMLDVSQYTGIRKRRNMDLIHFWTDKGKQQMRSTKLIWTPVTVA